MKCLPSKESNLRGSHSPTGEPDAGNPPAQFGGRGGATQCAVPTSIFANPGVLEAIECVISATIGISDLSDLVSVIQYLVSLVSESVSRVHHAVSVTFDAVSEVRDAVSLRRGSISSV